jgi:hypothetical protein
VGEAADPHVVVEEPGAAGLLEYVENSLPVPHAIEERRERADVHPVRPDRNQVADDPREFRHDHADVLHPLGDFDLEQFLAGDDKPEFVAHRGNVVHPVGIRITCW